MAVKESHPSRPRPRPRPNRRRKPVSAKMASAGTVASAPTPVGLVRRGVRRLAYKVWPERFPDWAPPAQERRVPRGFLVVWVAAVALAAAAFVAHLQVRFDIIQAGYSLSRAQAEQRRLRLSQRELRLEFATLKEPGRIEQLARTQLGMERPDHGRIIRLGERRLPRLVARRQ